jgi:cell division protein FtsI/penicillin-binding protein 2
MLAAIANGGKLFKPKLVKETIGMIPDRHPLGSFAASSYLAKKELQTIGIPFSLFTATQKRISFPAEKEKPAEIRRLIPMDEKNRATLIHSMAQVISGEKGGARPSIIKGLLTSPFLMREYLALQNQLVGKTGTAEIVCNLCANPSSSPQMYKYIWFGGIAFTDQRKTDPEIVVVVFLRFGDAGKEAAPLAAQMVHKWREIKKKHAVAKPS